jgi:sulfur carrier protein
LGKSLLPNQLRQDTSKVKLKALDMIKITINSQMQTIAENTSVSNLLIQIKQPENGIAIAINNHVVAKINWLSHVLQPDDQLLIIKATQGG